MKEAKQQKKVAHKKISKNRLEENKTKYKYIKNRTKKVVANSMRKEMEKRVNKIEQKTKLHFCTGEVYEKDIEGGRCMRGKDGKLGFNEKDRKKNMEKSLGGDYKKRE